MSDLFTEIKSDVQEDNFNKLMKRYAPVLGVFVAAILIGTIFFTWYQTNKNEQIYKEGGEYILASVKLVSGNSEEGVKRLEELSKGQTNYRLFGELASASVHITAGELLKAEQVYDKLINDKTVDTEFRNIAALRKGYCILSNKNNSPTEIEEKLLTLSKVLENTLYSASISEMLLVHYLNVSDREKAKKMYLQLSTNPELPESLIKRVEMYKQLL